MTATVTEMVSAPPETEVGDRWVTRLGHGLTGLMLWLNQEECALGKYSHQASYQSPEELGLQGFEQHSVQSIIPGKEAKTGIGLWYRKPADDGQPVYVMFHGRNGHWGYCGDPKYDPQEGFDPHYRVNWIKTMADTGAGVLAVHTRGFGLSGNGSTAAGFDLTEEAFRRDMKAIADDLLIAKGLAPERIVIVGESLGGAMAAMLAEEMTLRGQPPKALGLINTFDTMPNAVQPYANRARLTDPLEYYAKLGHINLPETIVQYVKGHRILGWQPGKTMAAQQVASYISQRMETIARLKILDKDKTALYIAHAPNDHRVQFEHAERLCDAANEAGIHCQFRSLTAEHMLAGGDRFPHTNWNPQTIAQDLEAVYRGHAITPNAAGINGHAHLHGRARQNGRSYPLMHRPPEGQQVGR